VASERIAVRQAVADDEAEILRLLALMDAEDAGSRATLITAEHLRSFVFCPTPRADALLAELGGVAVGLAAIRESASTLWSNSEIYLDDLFVVRETRRLGVGRCLLGAVSALAVERSATRVLLNVQTTNTSAMHFYESLGGVIFPESRCCAFSGRALSDLANSSAA